MGLGVGAAIGADFGQGSINFYVPLHSSRFTTVDFKESSGAFIFGERSLKTGPVPVGLPKPWSRRQVNVGLGFDNSKGKKLVFRKNLRSHHYKYQRLLGLLNRKRD